MRVAADAGEPEGFTGGAKKAAALLDDQQDRIRLGASGDAGLQLGGALAQARGGGVAAEQVG
jgi:hypothetical protein